MRKQLFVFLALSMATMAAHADTRIVTLNVEGMTCPVCPITVKKALNNVPGVEDATVNFDAKTATVKFDDKKTSIDQLTKATGQAGYPSTLKGPAK